MAEIVNNSASTTYTLTGSSTPQTVTSNTLAVNLNTSGLSLSKTASPTEFSAGDIITYTVVISNTGTNYLNGVRIIDDLGGDNLAYVVGSGSLTTSSETYPVTPVATNPLTFTLQQLAVGQTMTLTYKAQVVFNLPSSVTSITNSVQGIGYPASGTVTGSASSTIQKKNSGNFSVVKSASKTDVDPSESFEYYITLQNNNSAIANVSNVTDNLPQNFTLTGATLKIGAGDEVTLSSSDYTLSSSNQLVIPSGTGPQVIVPANGTTVITLTGYLS